MFEMMISFIMNLVAGIFTIFGLSTPFIVLGFMIVELLKDTKIEMWFKERFGR